MSQTQQHTKIDFLPLSGGGEIARLRFNRPEQANAFSSQMMTEISHHLKHLKTRENLRALVISGEGKHFSAGADLAWMQASAKLGLAENTKDASKLKDMFESIVTLNTPKIGVTQGAAYGGAVGLLACCDFVIAHNDARFCLSEAKLGLLPAVIAPYLLRKMRYGALKRLALTSQVFTAQEALDIGLVEIVTDDLEPRLYRELNALLACGPDAQIAINQLFESLRQMGFQQGQETVEAIAKARVSSEGQAGLASFFAKTEPPWLRRLD